MTESTIVAKDAADFAKQGADILERAIHTAAQANGVARVALSGGNTPSPTYQALAKRPLPFDRIEWWWVDERAVPPDNERSNFGKAKKDLALHDDGRHGKFFRMRGEASSLEAAAAEYEALLRRSFGVARAVAFDALVFGIGDDGHTASLFPGLGVVGVDDRLVLAVRAQPEKGLEARISLTSPVILEAKLAVGLVAGAAKRAPLAKLRERGPEDEIPSRIYKRARGEVVWLLDEAAAK